MLLKSTGNPIDCDDALKCPICHFNFLHHESVRWNRQSILIDFSCENCDFKSVLEIEQSKGQTFLRWNRIIALALSQRALTLSQRKPIKPSVRFQILKRDNYRCQMCGITAKDGATLEIDHIIPVSKGGTNDEDNLQVLCRDCNAGKSDQWQ